MSRAKERRPPPEAADADGPWLDEGEVEAKLLLFVGAPAEATDRLVREALGSGSLAALVLEGRGLPAGAIDGFRKACAQAGVALLLAGRARDALATRSDGVHLGSEAEVAEARRLLGRDALIGAACGMSRHAAMVAGEAGADYVLFGEPSAEAAVDELSDLLGWWSELFVIPGSAAGRLSLEAVEQLAAAGADGMALDLVGLDAVGGIGPVAEALRAGTETRRRQARAPGGRNDSFS